MLVQIQLQAGLSLTGRTLFTHSICHLDWPRLSSESLMLKAHIHTTLCSAVPLPPATSLQKQTPPPKGGSEVDSSDLQVCRVHRALMERSESLNSHPTLSPSRFNCCMLPRKK